MAHKHNFKDGRPAGDVDFWTVGTTPMTQAEAAEAAALISERFPHVGAFVVDPRASLTWGMDRDTVEAVRDALVGCGDDSTIGLIEMADEWLAATSDPDA